MSDGDAAAVDVVLLVVDAELIAAVDALRRERFVQFPEVDVVLPDADVLEQPWNREHGTDTHLVGFARGDREAAIDAHRLDAELAGAFGAHEERHGGAVGELRGVAGGHGAVFLERRGQARQTVEGGRRTVAFVAVHRDVHVAFFARLPVGLEHRGGHRRDLLGHPTRFRRRRVTLLALQGVHVLHLARHLVAARHDFRRVTHRHEDVRLLVEQALVRLGFAGFLAGTHGNRVDAAGDGHLGVTQGDLVRRDGDGLQAGRAEPVDGQARRGDRESGKYDREARQVAVLLARVAGRADHDVFHLVRRHVRVPVEQRVDEMRQHVIGPRQVEAAAEGLREARPDTVYHYHITHLFPLYWIVSRLSVFQWFGPERVGPLLSSRASVLRKARVPNGRRACRETKSRPGGKRRRAGGVDAAVRFPLQRPLDVEERARCHVLLEDRDAAPARARRFREGGS